MGILATITSQFDAEVLIRILMALILSGLIGYEREKTGHPAGLRTHILVCLTSAVLMTASQSFFLGDSIARMGAAIITGIGFLGAGAIIGYGREVFGLTTAAGIWSISGLGILIGIGAYFEAVLATIAFLIVLKLKPIEMKAIHAQQMRGKAKK
ncbi:MAG: MgtC/SapB family protein [Nanoarchaeota archaeon]|nr:MgtC/SapB family protein [Nanoarchaeota archaeon]